MGWRFRRRVRLFPGVRLNISKSGGSLSVGGRGLTANIGRRGTRATIGLPGTGISYQTRTAGGPGKGGKRGASLLGGLVLVLIVVALLHRLF